MKSEHTPGPWKAEKLGYGGAFTVEEVSTASDVYFDQLQAVFTEATGLDTHL